MAHQDLSRWTSLAWSYPGPFGLDLAKKKAIYGALDVWIGAWNWQKRLPHQCMRKVLVRSAQVLCINGITAAKNVTKKVQK